MGMAAQAKAWRALQFAAATARGKSWQALPVSPGRAVFISAEDDKDERHCRLAAISEVEGFDLLGLDQLTLRSLAGCDALL